MVYPSNVVTHEQKVLYLLEQILKVLNRND